MGQTPRSRSQWKKNNGIHRKVLSQEMLMCNIKALVLTVIKVLARLKFLKIGSNFKVKVTVSKIMVPTEGLIRRNTHVKYESSSTHHSLFKSY